MMAFSIRKPTFHTVQWFSPKSQAIAGFEPTAVQYLIHLATMSEHSIEFSTK